VNLRDVIKKISNYFVSYVVTLLGSLKLILKYIYFSYALIFGEKSRSLKSTLKPASRFLSG